MKKTALTSILSLKVACPFCTLDQMKGSKLWWNKYKTELRAQSKEAYNVLQLIFKIPKKLINYNAVEYTNNSLLTVSLF
jgi:hypothetical protein